MGAVANDMGFGNAIHFGQLSRYRLADGNHRVHTPDKEPFETYYASLLAGRKASGHIAAAPQFV